MRPVVALTCGTQNSTGSVLRDVTNHAYADAVCRAGGAPLIVPPGDEPEAVQAAVATAAALILTGGKDICPGCYGEDRLPQCGEIEPARDLLDRWAVEAAWALGMPVLGICRGIQAMAVFRGGSLLQDLPTQTPGGLLHRQAAGRSRPTHEVAVEPGSLLADVVGPETLGVNSFHHQAVNRLPPGFRVSGRSPDGTIEAIEADDGRFCLGVQWHPEDLAATHPRHHALFAALVAAAGGSQAG